MLGSRAFVASFVIFCTPVLMFSVTDEYLETRKESIESLIEQQSFRDACLEIESILDMEDELEEVQMSNMVEFAIEKVKYFAQEGKNFEEDADSLLDYDLSHLIRHIINYLFKISDESANRFALEMLDLTYKKWPEIAKAIIDELFVQYNLSVERVEPLIDRYLSPQEPMSIFLYLDQLDSRYEIIGSIMRSLRDYALVQSPAVKIAAIRFGKKYIESFFAGEYLILRETLYSNYEIFKKNFHTNFSLDDRDEETTPFFDIFAIDDKDLFIRKFMEALSGMIASLLLNVLTLMDEHEGALYLRTIHYKFLACELEAPANGLKEYILRPPQTEAEEAYFNKTYFMENPNGGSGELISFPESFKTIFQ